MPESDISVEELRELVSLDPATGLLTWKKRGRHHFPSLREHNRWNNRFAGKPAFDGIGHAGYKRGKLKGHDFRAHRVVWAIHHGHWPVEQIDHINGDKLDNRPENLRDAPQSVNQRNRPMTCRNTTGVVGVYRFRDRWIASIRLRDKHIHLGVFDTIEEAAAARKTAEAQHGFSPNHGRPASWDGPGPSTTKEP